MIQHRLTTTVALLTVAAWSFAETATTGTSNLGTKPDVVTPPPTGNGPVVGGADFLQMGVAMVVVFLLLKFALPKVMNKLGGRVKSSTTGGIVVEESTPFGGGSLQVVTIRGRTLLIAVTTQGASCLADLTARDEAPVDDRPAFFDVLDAQTDVLDRPAPEGSPTSAVQATAAKAYGRSVTQQDETLGEGRDVLQARLERLTRLSQ